MTATITLFPTPHRDPQLARWADGLELHGYCIRIRALARGSYVAEARPSTSAPSGAAHAEPPPAAA